MTPFTDDIAPRGACGSGAEDFLDLLAEDTRQARAAIVGLPSYAVRRAPRSGGETALRPVRDLIAIAQETGRTVRLHVLPDDADFDVSRELVATARLGTDGSVQVAVGPTSGVAPWRGFGPPPASPAGRRPGPIS